MGKTVPAVPAVATARYVPLNVSRIFSRIGGPNRSAREWLYISITFLACSFLKIVTSPHALFRVNSRFIQIHYSPSATMKVIFISSACVKRSDTFSRPEPIQGFPSPFRLVRTHCETNHPFLTSRSSANRFPTRVFSITLCCSLLFLDWPTRFSRPSWLQMI